MCGIFGIVAQEVDRGFLEKATNTLTHRGPDDFGFYLDSDVGLGHRRLSIIDVDGGQQPMFNEDRSKCILYNGEIYNYVALMDVLISKGHRFSTRSDTEVVLHAYEEWGENCVKRFRGMFAFAIWDLKSKSLFLARDRLGIKPLYYCLDGRSFSFASEQKAILSNTNLSRDIDELALVSYFNLSYIPSDLSIYERIRKLLPGHSLTYENGKMRIRKYWDLEMVPDMGKTEAQFEQGFMDLLQEAVEMRLMSEVPIGAFLSGGIDSSLIVALMSLGSSSPTNTFCMGFKGGAGGHLDERKFARLVSDRYETNHREFEVLPTAEGLIDKIVDSFDEPFADDSTIPSYFISKIASENVTVALSGLGGDEIFSGYERHLGFVLSRYFDKIPAVLRNRLIRPLVEGLPERTDGHYSINHLKRFTRSSALPADQRYFEYISRMTPQIRDTIFSDSGRFGPYFGACRDLILAHYNSPNAGGRHDSLNRALYCDMKNYLPEDILAVTDRMSMQHGLEVRVPFLDHEFVEYCGTIPASMKMKWLQKKRLLKSASRSYLPRSIITHRKQGFVGPMTNWLKNDLKPYVLESLSKKNLDKHGFLNPKTVDTILKQHFSGQEIHDTLIWSMVIFQTWFSRYIHDR